MFRIDDPSAVAQLPVSEAAGQQGYFTEGQPGVTPATLVRASWLNMVQEELCAIVVASGLEPSKKTSNQLLQALRRAGVFQTAPQFDATTKPATTDFVQQAQGGMVKYVSIIVSRALKVDDIGAALYFSGPGLTLTVPPPSALGIPDNSGKCVRFFGLNNSGTIVPVLGANIGFNTSGVPSLAIKPGQFLTLMATGPGNWQVIDSTAEMGRNADFAAMLSSSGFQQLPSGMILQMGGGAQTPASGFVDVIFPIPFPNACFHVFPAYEGQDGTGAAAPININAGMKTKTGCRLYTYSGNALSAGITPSYLAIGN